MAEREDIGMPSASAHWVGAVSCVRSVMMPASMSVGTTGIRQGARVPYPPDAPVSPLGYGIWADGLGRVLDRLHQMLPGTPLLVPEYGIGTSDDTQRAAYLERGLQVTNDAIARSIDVRGLFHWTAVDNYEWLNGYELQFGIIDRDRNVRPSARVLQHEARATGAANGATG